MRLKDASINLSNLSPQLVLGLVIVDGVMKEFGGEAVITSANDSIHGHTSLHYS